MIRRSFRLGLRVGLLLGVVAAIVKVAQSRRPQPATDGWSSSPPWNPPAPAVTTPAVTTPTVTPAAAPAPPAVTPPAVTPPPAPTPPPPLAPGPPSALEAAVATDPALGAELTGLTPAPAPRPPAKATKAAKAAKAPVKAPAKASKAAPATAPLAWVEPVGGTCPPTHPVKAKLTSRIFHLPGMFAYDRTRPDRCYAEESSAVADGFARAKR